MPIEGIEWFVVTVIVILMILWKPERIRDMARALAKARAEFEKAQRDLQGMVMTTMNETDSEDRKLIEIAKKFEIKTEGLTREQIREGISKKYRSYRKTKISTRGFVR